MVERGKPNKDGSFEEIEILADDAPLTDEELFDEDGDIPDDDEVIIGGNGVDDDEADEESEED